MYGFFSDELSDFKSDYSTCFRVNETLDEEDEEEEISLKELKNGERTHDTNEGELEWFHEKYGPYMEFIYIFNNGDMSKLRKTLKTNAQEFFIVVEYLFDKRRLENNNNKYK